MGHVESTETAEEAAWRELREETGLGPGHALGAWQLERVDTFFLADADAVVLCPGFAVEVSADPPRLGEGHEAHRWVRREEAGRAFLWPGQRAAVEHIVAEILEPASPSEPRLRRSVPGGPGDETGN